MPQAMFCMYNMHQIFTRAILVIAGMDCKQRRHQLPISKGMWSNWNEQKFNLSNSANLDFVTVFHFSRQYPGVKPGMGYGM